MMGMDDEGYVDIWHDSHIPDAGTWYCVQYLILSENDYAVTKVFSNPEDAMKCFASVCARQVGKKDEWCEMYRMNVNYLAKAEKGIIIAGPNKEVKE